MSAAEGYRGIRLAEATRVERRVWPLSLLVALLRFQVVLPHLDAPGKALLLLLCATLCAQGVLLTRFADSYLRFRTAFLIHLKLCFIAVQNSVLQRLRLTQPTVPALLFNMCVGTGALPSLLCSIGLQTTPVVDGALAALTFWWLRSLDVCSAVCAAGQQPAAQQLAAALQRAFSKALGALLSVTPPRPHAQQPCACEQLVLFAQLFFALGLPLVSLVVLECQAAVLCRVRRGLPRASDPASLLEALCLQGPLLSTLLLAAIAGVVWQAAGLSALLLMQCRS